MACPAGGTWLAGRNLASPRRHEPTERNIMKMELQELLLQGLETERGGVQIYTTALRCVLNDDLKQEWEEYLEHTTRHEQIMTNVLTQLGIDPEKETPGRAVVRHIGTSLVTAMEMALASAPPEAAEIVAGECVVQAETKDHLNWELMGLLAEQADAATAKVLSDAVTEVEEEEDEHLYHSTGWTRELWVQALGMPAVLPPPEEQKNVKTAIGAARAKNARDDMT
jgi:rubrerythrin